MIERFHRRECHDPLEIKADRERGLCYRCVAAGKQRAIAERDAVKASRWNEGD